MDRDDIDIRLWDYYLDRLEDQLIWQEIEAEAAFWREVMSWENDRVAERTYPCIRLVA